MQDVLIFEDSDTLTQEHIATLLKRSATHLSDTTGMTLVYEDGVVYPEGKGVTCKVIPEDQMPVEVAPPTLDPFRQQIFDLLQRRTAMLKSTEQFVWFTFRQDEQGDIFVSWPVSGYQHLPSRIIARDERVIQAGSRLKQRHHIKAITVIGPIRSYDQYFPWIKEQYEV